MKKRAIYIVFEGTEGVGKTTQVARTVALLRAEGYKVLETKEPGTSHLPLTQDLRKIILDQSRDNELDPLGREMITQAIRSIHLHKLISPSLNEYDYIIQDRGIVSGMSYGLANKISEDLMMAMNNASVQSSGVGRAWFDCYDKVIYLSGDAKANLEKAKSAKQEFTSGDVMENKGANFISEVEEQFHHYLSLTKRVEVIEVTGKSIEEVSREVMKGIYES